MLPDADHRNLPLHPETCETEDDQTPPVLAHVLLHKLTSSGPPRRTVPDDVVARGMPCQLFDRWHPVADWLSVAQGQEGVGQRSDAGFLASRCDLIGTRVGERAPLLCDDGTISAVAVLKVTRPS
mgnify:CR=1 FL=1